MQIQNVAEYLEIRKELTALKDCITTYVGFVLVGSAAAVFGLAGRASDGEPVQIAMALGSIFLCLISTCVLFLLSYKFSSHNRYVGYSKLLAHEELKSDSLSPNSLFLWEICVDKLRDCNYKKDLLWRYCKQVQPWTFGVGSLRARIEEQVNEVPQSATSLRGLLLLLFGTGEKRGSWKFPVSVARVFAALNFILVLFAGYFFHAAPSFYWLRRVTVVLFVLLVFAWLMFLSKLYDQVAGIERVESFCWLFVPIRSKFLHQLYPGLKYHLKMVSEIGSSGTSKGAGA